MDAKHHQDRFITEQKVSPPPTFSPEPTSPESTAPGNTDPLYPLLKRAPRLEKTNAHCVREKIPGVLHISDVLKRSPVQHPPTSLTSTDCLLFICPHWLLEPWQPAALPPSVPLVTGDTDSSSLYVLTGFLNRGSPLPFLHQCRSSQHPPTSLTSTDSSSLRVLTGFLNRGSPLPFLLQCRSSQVSLVSKFL
ncbi:hypothetical protein N7534_006810 [Penicillium rubens]|nr:hypothetical protein N7534_006810 [Penicillium rubens]